MRFFPRALIMLFFFHSKLTFDMAAANETVLFNYLLKLLPKAFGPVVYDTNKQFMRGRWTFAIEGGATVLFRCANDKKQTFYIQTIFLAVFSRRQMTCFLVLPLWGFELYQLG